jgi:hypothetical protein
MDKETKKIAKLLGSRGGKKTFEKYGAAHMQKIAKLSAQSRQANAAKKKTENV